MSERALTLLRRMAVIGLALAAAAPALARERLLPAVPDSPAGAATTDRFRLVGVRDAVGVATVFHCTNLGPATTAVAIILREFDGTPDCTLTFAVLPAQQSATLATRQTLLYDEDGVCGTAPLTNTGSALVRATTAGFADLICTAQVVGSAAATPRFATELTLFSPHGDLIRDRIFTDGFETGNTSRW